MEPREGNEKQLGGTKRNRVGDKVRLLRLFGPNNSTGHLALTHGELAGQLIDAIMEVAPPTAPIRQRQRFSRSDVVKIEAGTRSVRDYELLALAQVFDVSVQELLGLPIEGKVPADFGKQA